MRILLVLAALLGPLPALGAQTAPLPPGTRIRVTVIRPALATHVGTFQALADSALLLRTRTSPLVIPRTAIGRIERSDGRRPSVVGGVAGFVVGAAAGTALACLANRDSYGVFCGGQNDTKLAVGAILGGAAGAAAGALLFRRDRWRPVEAGAAGTEAGQ